MKSGYLTNEVLIEPTIAGWYAWIQLLPPHTLSLNLQNRYFPILDSFINFPELHQKAATEPKLFGGPYLNLPGVPHEKIYEYRDGLRKSVDELFVLASEIASLNKVVQNFTGESFDGLYASLSSNLKDCVELVYGEYNNPHIRYIEPILYKKYFHIISKLQKVIVYPRQHDRPFVLSTPRLATMQNAIEIQMPFKSMEFDKLVKSSDEAVNVEEMFHVLGVNEHDRQFFEKLFSNTKQKKDNCFYQETVSLKYFGHACVLIQAHGKAILIDPLVTSFNLETSSIFTYDDLPDVIDFVLITHAHKDHFNIETLLRIRHKVKNIIVPQNNNGSLLDPSMKFALLELGFNKVYTLEEFDTFSEDEISIIALPFWGEHADFDIRSKSVYLISIYGKNIMFATDMNFMNDFSYRDFIPDLEIDALFIGTEFVGASADWLYGPLMFNKTNQHNKSSRRLSSSSAIKAHKLAKSLKAKSVYVYALGQEPWLPYIMGIKSSSDNLQNKEADELVKLLCNDGIYAKKLFMSENIKI